MARLKYEGPLPVVEVQGFGHFSPGDSKEVDRVTAGAFTDPRCVAEGWVVEFDEPVVEPPPDGE